MAAAGAASGRPTSVSGRPRPRQAGSSSAIAAAMRSSARAIEPFEDLGGGAPRQDREQRRGQVDAMNLGFAMRPQPIARVPQPPRRARPEPGGAAGALIGAVQRDALGRQGIDAAIRIVAATFCSPRVDHRRYAAHGQRRLRDVGGDDDPAPRGRRRQRAILRARRRAIRGAAPAPHRAGERRRRSRRSPTRSRARPAGSTARCRVVRGSTTLNAAAIDSPGPYSISSGCSDPGTSMIGQPPRNADTGLRIQRRRHHHDAKIGSRQPRLLRQRKTEIGVNAPLVKLVDDDRRDVAQQRILLQVGGEDAFGDDEQACVAR